jgi:hypothetical protein
VNGERRPIGTTWGIISIGRNINSTSGKNLPPTDWQTFKRDVSDLFASVDFEVSGTSTSEEHGSEETYQVGGTFALSLDDLRSTLAALARWFFQDAISLTIGGGERIEASAGLDSIYARKVGF